MTNEAMHTRTPYEGEIMKARMHPPMDENEYGKAELMPGTYRICRECTGTGQAPDGLPNECLGCGGIGLLPLR